MIDSLTHDYLKGMYWSNKIKMFTHITVLLGHKISAMGGKKWAVQRKAMDPVFNATI